MPRHDYSRRSFGALLTIVLYAASVACPSATESPPERAAVGGDAASDDARAAGDGTTRGEPSADDAGAVDGGTHENVGDRDAALVVHIGDVVVGTEADVRALSGVNVIAGDLVVDENAALANFDALTSLSAV